MSKIFGFYHICTIGKWHQVVDEQIQTILNSGPYQQTEKIFVSIVGSECHALTLPDKFEIVYTSTDMSCYERWILKYLYNFCLNQIENVRVWYIHAKGVSHSDKPLTGVHGGWAYITAWRKCMEHFVITQYKSCLDALIDYDTCGINLHTKPSLHYSGNFWWANSDYIKTLQMSIDDDYLSPEMWICSRAGKHFCLHETGVDHYVTYYPTSKYIKFESEHIEPRFTITEIDPDDDYIEEEEVVGRKVYIFYICTDTNNLLHFMQKGYQEKENIIYIFIGTNQKNLHDNVIFYKARHTYCFDNWAEALKEYNLYEKLTDNDRVILINHITRGPYLKGDTDWISKLTSMITSRTKLAGISINCHNNPSAKQYYHGSWIYDYVPHVQNLLYVTDKIGLKVAFDNGIFTIKPDEHEFDKVYRQEVGFSIAMLTSGYRINCLLSRYKDKDYCLPINMCLNNPSVCNGDPFVQNGYFGGNIDPFEAMFIRTDRQFFVEMARSLSSVITPQTLSLEAQQKINGKYCVYVPPDDISINVFNEFATTLVNAVRKKGYVCAYSNHFLPDHKHIILGAIRFSDNESRKNIPKDSIIFNLEQLYDQSPLINNQYIDMLRNYSVWDYSLDNITWLRKNQIIYNVKHVSIGNIQDVPITHLSEDKKDIDVLFYGSLNDRRMEIYLKLKQRFPDKNIVFEPNVWGEQRNNLIARSKIVLNIHFFESKNFEVIHVMHLLANQAFVISEDNLPTAVDNELAKGFVSCSYTNMVDVIGLYLNDPVIRQEISQKGYDIIRSRPQTVALRDALTNIEETQLSILICSIESRVDTFLPNIFRQLRDQVKDLPVEVISLVDNKRISIGEKRNRLVDMAKGKYVVMVDDDDIISDDYVKSLFSAMEEDSDIVVFLLERYENDKFDRLCTYGVEYETDQNLENVYIRLPNHIACIRKSIAEKIKFPLVNNGEDYSFAGRLKPLIKTQTRINKVIYRYNYHFITSTSRPL